MHLNISSYLIQNPIALHLFEDTFPIGKTKREYQDEW